jgi:hypothetical protein
MRRSLRRTPLTVRYEGPAVRVEDFVATLEQDGYSVDYWPPTYHGAGDQSPEDMATALLFVSGSGSGRSVNAVAKDFAVSHAEMFSIGIEVVGGGDPAWDRRPA